MKDKTDLNKIYENIALVKEDISPDTLNIEDVVSNDKIRGVLSDLFKNHLLIRNMVVDIIEDESGKWYYIILKDAIDSDIANTLTDANIRFSVYGGGLAHSELSQYKQYTIMELFV
jgi:hypothetical protein